MEGSAVWLAPRVQCRKQLAVYLNVVKQLFSFRRDYYDEGRALFLLHQCGYDVPSAGALLKPWEEDAGEVADKPAFYDSDSEDNCYICKDGGNLLICDVDNCGKVYHLGCVDLPDFPPGRWECPRHHCLEKGCDSPAHKKYRCVKCPGSYCATHVPEDLLPNTGLVRPRDFKCSKCSYKKALMTADQHEFLLELLAILQVRVHNCFNPHNPHNLYNPHNPHNPHNPRRWSTLATGTATMMAMGKKG
jgi:hypothetical protein